MEIIQLGSSGDLVTKWQTFLVGSGWLSSAVSGEFDQDTVDATKAYQGSKEIEQDGVVGPATLAAAKEDSFGEVTDFPDKPTTIQPIGSDEQEKYFGKLTYVSNPLPGNPENIQITNDWVSKYITKVNIIQLKNMPGTNGGNIFWHKDYTDNLIQLYKDWDDAGLMPLVLTWAGSWAPRFVRGSRTVLSNHCRSSAFDINVQWNMLGRKPAPQGTKGSIVELIPAAVNNCFWNGGWFDRQDGMHFEIAKKVE